MNTTSHELKCPVRHSSTPSSNSVLTSSRRHNEINNGLLSPLDTAGSDNVSYGQGKPFAVLPACLPMDIFKVGKRSDEVILASRKFQGETYTILSHSKLGVREFRVFVALIAMLMDGCYAHLGDDEPFLDRVRISDIKRFGAVSSNYSDLKNSLELLQNTSFRACDDESGPLITLDSDDGLSTMTVGFHSLVTDAIKSCLNFYIDTFTPFTVIYLGEQYQLKVGKHSKIALMMHAYFSQSVSQGNVSTPHSLSTLAKKMFDIPPSEVTRNHIKAIKGGLMRLNEIAWGVEYRSRSVCLVSRPTRAES